jgi:putative transposase
VLSGTILRRMARLPRFFVTDLPLHIIQRGNNRDPIFGCPADFAFLYERLAVAARAHGVSVHAYVLMTNHLHLLVTPSLPTSVPRMMQSLGRIYVAYFNGRYRRTGTLWEGRYKAAIVEQERYLLLCMRYIELNPVRARMVERPSDYRWSSFRANAGAGVDRLIRPHPIYEQIGESAGARQTAYRELFGPALPEDDVRDIRDATQNAWALGSPDFQRKISRLARRAQRLPAGRKAKTAADEEINSAATDREIRV